jgi:hypothetical protein
MSIIDTLVFRGITAINPLYVDIKLFIPVVISSRHFRQTFRVVQFPPFISYSLYIRSHMLAGNAQIAGTFVYVNLK